MDERERRAVGDRELEALMGDAGPRPEIPAEDLEAITRAARDTWRRQVAERRESPFRRARPIGSTGRTATAVRLAVGVAALLVVALGLSWWLGLWGPASAASAVGRVDAVVGVVRMGVDEVGAGAAVPPDAEIETGAAGRASLRLGEALVARLDSATRLRVLSAEVLELRAGALYLDTGALESAGPADRPRVEVRTPVGTVRDVGTRFVVRMEEDGGGALAVRVRDGAVVVARRDETFRAGPGEELLVRKAGVVERRAVLPYGEAWSWVLAAAPRFELEGRSLDELLDWVSRETGWSVRFEDEELAEAADGITLHGSLGALRPDQAPFAVLPGAGLDGSLDEGTLTVRRAASQ